MKRVCLAGLLLAFNGCLTGCTQQMDKELMEARRQIVTNEALYAKAQMAFADAIQAEFDKLIIYQQKSLQEQTDNWVRKYTTADGTVSAPPGMVEKMFKERDERATVLAKSQEVRNSLVANFRSMVADKQRLVGIVYTQEANAQQAREAAGAAWDSLFKSLMGALPAAAIGIPLALP